MIKLGDMVKDPVTGIKGIAYGRTKYLQGCDRIMIQEPAIRKAGEPAVVPELFHVDEPQLVVVKKQVVKKSVESSKKPGGPSCFKTNSQQKGKF